MGFALWIDKETGIAWAQGTQEYRPMGAAAICHTDQFRPRDFQRRRNLPLRMHHSFAGFFGSLEEVNEYLRKHTTFRLRPTPYQVR